LQCRIETAANQREHRKLDLAMLAAKIPQEQRHVHIGFDKQNLVAALDARRRDISREHGIFRMARLTDDGQNHDDLKDIGAGHACKRRQPALRDSAKFGNSGPKPFATKSMKSHVKIS